MKRPATTGRAPSPGSALTNDGIVGAAGSRASETAFRAFLSAIDLGALMLDTQGRVVFINDHLLARLERTREGLLGRDWIDVVVPEADRTVVRRNFLDGIATGRMSEPREDEIVTHSGAELRLAWTNVIQRSADGRVTGLASIAQDVTDARRNESERAVLAAGIEQSAESVMITDRDARIVYVNGAFERLSGYTSAEVIGRNPRLLKSREQPATFYDAMWAALSNGVPFVADMTNRRKDGSLYHLMSVISPIRGSDGAIHSYVASARDVTQERELETTAKTLARERVLIAETIRSLPAGGSLEATAELFCRQVSSLTDVAMASLAIFEADGLVMPLAFVAHGAKSTGLGRLSPDRSRYLREHAAVGPWVETWMKEKGHPFASSMRKAGVQALAYAPITSHRDLIGILVVGSAEPDGVARLSEQLGAIVDFADLAGALLGDRVGDRTEVDRLRSVIQRVIADRAFMPVFQPIVDITTGQIVGHEALTRFSDGVRPDVRFLDAATIGLGLELEVATIEAAVVASAGLPPSKWLHLNVSPELVLERSHLHDLVRMTSECVVLEVTEHAAVGDYAEFRNAIDSIDHEIVVAVDDAGAGFSSFRHILELQPTFVKLDISIVRGIDSDPAKQALVAGMHHFARSTDRRLIAEGVETEAEADTLRALEIRLAQGYLFGRPAPIVAE